MALGWDTLVVTNILLNRERARRAKPVGGGLGNRAARAAAGVDWTAAFALDTAFWHAHPQ